MIYALLDPGISHEEQVRIAAAIQDRNALVIAEYVHRGVIRHVKDVQPGHTLYCIFCRIRVFPTNRRGPAAWNVKNHWHFQHAVEGDRPDECIGWARYDEDSAGIENPANHGCYIEMGCEQTSAGARTEYHRTRCKTVLDRNTYCHHARNAHCLAPM